MEYKNKIFNKICELTENYNWNIIKLEINFTRSGGYGVKSYYSEKGIDFQKFSISLVEFYPSIEEIINRFHELKKTEDRFNKVLILIKKNSEVDIAYTYDIEKIRVEKLNNSLVFYQWANETLMNRIFDYEKEHNLLKPIYDEDDDLVDYENSWDSGVFTFKIVNNKLDYTIELIKDGISRNLPMPLPEYFVNGLLEHYQITNEELKEEWQPWNTLVIKSPNNDIPYNSWEEYITYSFER